MPFTTILVTFMPAVISVTSSARATLGAKMFWSRRTRMPDSKSLLLFLTSIVCWS